MRDTADVYLDQQPSTSSRAHSVDIQFMRTPSPLAIEISATPSPSKRQCTSPIIQRNRAPAIAPPSAPKKGLLKSINITRTRELTPREKNLYKKAQRLKRIADYHKKNINTAKLKRLSEKSNFLSKMKNLNAISQAFFKCQLGTQNVHPKGRRFTFDDKVFALSIFKQS